jgi:DNA-binding transcriptional ArsR family regulator
VRRPRHGSHRLASVRFLARHGESCCTQVIQEAGLELSKSTFSHHLRILRDAGLVTKRIQGGLQADCGACLATPLRTRRRAAAVPVREDSLQPGRPADLMPLAVLAVHRHQAALVSADVAVVIRSACGLPAGFAGPRRDVARG